MPSAAWNETGWEPVILKFIHQITHRNAQRLGDFDQRAQGNVHVPALDFPDEIMMEVGLFRQFLLGEVRPLAESADFLTDDAAIFGPRFVCNLTWRSGNKHLVFDKTRVAVCFARWPNRIIRHFPDLSRVSFNAAMVFQW